MAEIGEPVRRRVLFPQTEPAPVIPFPKKPLPPKPEEVEPDEEQVPA